MSRGAAAGTRPPIIDAHPPDVNSLPDVEGDPRTANKLFVGARHGAGGGAPWAPPPSQRKPVTDVRDCRLMTSFWIAA